MFLPFSFFNADWNVLTDSTYSILLGRSSQGLETKSNKVSNIMSYNSDKVKLLFSLIFSVAELFNPLKPGVHEKVIHT